MHFTTVELIALAVLAIAFVTYRQSQWQPVRGEKLIKMPLVLAVGGLFSLAGLAGTLSGIGFLDVAIIATELVAGVAVGCLMGRCTQIATVDGRTQSRLSSTGLVVWLGFIALRIGLGVLAAVLGATVASQPATMLLVLAVIKTVQAVLVWGRVQQHRGVGASRGYAVSRF